MDSFGLTIQLYKSVLIKKKQIIFLGFTCPETMTVRLSVEMIDELLQCCKILTSKRSFIRHFAKMIGKMVASEPGVDYAALFYKPFEKVEAHKHRIYKGNFDCYMKLSRYTKYHFQW